MSNTTKQLTQEQIDSLNAVYAKMNDDSLVLEIENMGKWENISSTTTDIDRIKYILENGYQYRIKEKKKVTKFKVEEKLLPFVDKITGVICRHSATSYVLNIRLYSESYEDLKEWQVFSFGIQSLEVEE